MLHQTDAFGFDQIAGLIQQGHMDGYEVAVTHHFFDAVRLPDLGRQAPRRVDSDFRIIAVHIHAQLDRRVRDQAADLAQSDDAEHMLRQLDSGEVLLAVLDRLTDLLVRTRKPIDEAYGGNQIARRQEYACNNQFLDRIGIGAGSIEHRNPALVHGGDRDIVGAGAGAADRLHRRRNFNRVHVVRTHQDSVRRVDVRSHGIALRGQAFQANRGNRVERQDAQGISHVGLRTRA